MVIPTTQMTKALYYILLIFLLYQKVTLLPCSVAHRPQVLCIIMDYYVFDQSLIINFNYHLHCMHKNNKKVGS